MAPKTYVFGAALFAIGAIGICMMIAKPDVHPLWIIFLYSIPSNSAISLFPHEPVLVWYGKFVNLWGLSVSATLGTILAGYLDYKFFTPVLNLSYSRHYKSSRTYMKAHYWFSKYPFIAIAIAGFSPIPFFLVKFMAFSSKYPVGKYLSALALARFPRYYLLALTGYVFQIPDWAIFGSFAVMLLLIYHRKIFDLISRLYAGMNRRAKSRPFRGSKAMPQNIPISLAVRMGMRTLKNMMLKRPICIALEITHNCTANCRHCDKGPTVEDNAVGAAEYKRICEDLSPSMIQIAGGEPLLRKDLPEIVRTLYRGNKPPFLVLITNASLLTVEKYHELREAGIRQYSISLDFPDRRHDENRRIPGLFGHLSALVPKLMSYGHNDVAINTCITHENYLHISEIARLVENWGAKLNFSVYTPMRTHNDELSLNNSDGTAKLREIIDEFYDPARAYRSVMTSKRVFDRYCQYFENGNFMPDCRAGRRSLVVNPDGRLTPCAMIIERRYDSRKELVEKFSESNDCGGCFVSIRANTEKTAMQLLRDNLRTLRMSRNGDMAKNRINAK